ncbi:MAG: hypothetical protein JW888_00120 [Pirellulales bacterium]|nr:hypothetical protein [Pirellulales bacterium]
MIAPLRLPETPTRERHGRLREAREYLATTVLGGHREERGPAVAAWKAWTLVGWMVVATAFYAASMLGWW